VNILVGYILELYQTTKDPNFAEGTLIAVLQAFQNSEVYIKSHHP